MHDGEHSRDLLAGRIGNLVMRIPGVAHLSVGAIADLGKFVGVNSPAWGIKLGVKDDAATVDIHVVVEFGRPIPEITRQIQRAVTRMLGEEERCKVESVNVFVQGVAFGEEAETYRKQAIALLNREVIQAEPASLLPKEDVL